MLPYFKFGSPTTCTYCGEPATELDHLFAVSRQLWERKHKGNRLKHYGPVTYCCCHCNDALSFKEFDTFLERCLFISKLYSKKGKVVVWSNKQIKELDYKLGTFIEHERNKRLWFRSRADWYESRNFLLGISQLIFEPSLDKTSPKFNEHLYNYFYSAVCLANIYKD